MSQTAPPTATVTATGVPLDDIRAGLERLLTIAGPIARLTPNKLDDAAVAFLRSLLDSPAQLAKAVAPVVVALVLLCGLAGEAAASHCRCGGGGSGRQGGPVKRLVQHFQERRAARGGCPAAEAFPAAPAVAAAPARLTPATGSCAGGSCAGGVCYPAGRAR